MNKSQKTKVQSDEATARGLELAAQQGKLFLESVRHMIQDVADGGDTKTVGDYKVGYAIEEAEGLYVWRNRTLEWTEPESENLHVEVFVADADDGRFLPGLTVSAALIDEQGKQLGPHEQPFLWHPTLYHYGRNWQVPGDGRYRLRIRVEAPTFPRHDKTNGRRYAQPVEVEFDNVEVKIGGK